MSYDSKPAIKLAFAGIVAISSSLTGGCRSLQYFSQVSGADQFAKSFPEYELNVIKSGAEGYIFHHEYTYYPDKLRRNQYISVKMFDIDREYFNFVSLLNVSDTGVASFSDFAQLGLTTAATAIPVVQTTKVLATAATAVGGARAIYNEDLLRTQTLQALQTQMDADRIKIKNIIVDRMDNCSAAQYPIGFVLSDLQAYAAAGTVDSAIASLSNSATKAKQTATTSSSTASADSGEGSKKSGEGGKKSGEVIIEGARGKLTYNFTPTNNCPLPSGGLEPKPSLSANSKAPVKTVASSTKTNPLPKADPSNKSNPAPNPDPTPIKKG
ncbi:hypothetical protein V3H18_08575 [Methylocystis sp. 9N]|uniref:Lipoprotein n=1 Tax=Methylocystis borbori TaxID=3118750 RepID=A0ABU7XGS6_9HYPH